MKQNKSEPVKTVLTITVGFIVIFFISKSKWPLYVALITGLLGLLSPYIAGIIDYLWMQLTKILGLIMPNILLGIVFYLFLFPISLFGRMFGKKDSLKLKNTGNSLYETTDRTYTEKSLEFPW